MSRCASQKKRQEIHETPQQNEGQPANFNASLADPGKCVFDLDEFRARKARKADEAIRKRMLAYIDDDEPKIEEIFREIISKHQRIGNFHIEEAPWTLKTSYDIYNLIAWSDSGVFVVEIHHQVTARDVKNFAAKGLSRLADGLPLKIAETMFGRPHLKIYGLVGGEDVTPEAAAAALNEGLGIMRLHRLRELETDTSQMRAIKAD